MDTAVRVCLLGPALRGRGLSGGRHHRGALPKRQNRKTKGADDKDKLHFPSKESPILN